MQRYTIKLIYQNNPFPRWKAGDNDFGAFADSEDKVIEFLIKNNASPEGIKFEYEEEDKRPAKVDFESEFRERVRTGLRKHT